MLLFQFLKFLCKLLPHLESGCRQEALNKGFSLWSLLDNDNCKTCSNYSEEYRYISEAHFSCFYVDKANSALYKDRNLIDIGMLLKFLLVYILCFDETNLF